MMSDVPAGIRTKRSSLSLLVTTSNVFGMMHAMRRGVSARLQLLAH
jgi:hypothetical protein